jgi:hypothetical protein
MKKNHTENSASSHCPPSREEIISLAKSDVQIIYWQILKFIKMPWEKQTLHFQQHRYDALCSIPHPDGKGHLTCGALAWKKFGLLANRVIEFDPELARRVSAEQLRKIVVDVFARYIIKEQREIDLSTIEQILADAANIAKQSLQTTEHYLPCVLFLNGGPDEFKIGPVTFTRRITFFKNHKQAFRRSLDKSISAHIEHVYKIVGQGFPHERATTPEQSKHFIRGLHARAIKTYRSYPWVATVRLINCDQAVSEERAARIVEVALHVIRVYLGAEHTKQLRLAWSRGDALRAAGMWADSGDLIHMRISSRSIGPVGLENWYDALTQNGSLDLQIFGSALYPLTDAVASFHLHERFIDAINWFGDAATDPEASASVVKYTSAIERLFFGKFHDKHTKVFASRIAHVFGAFNCDDGKTHKNAIKVYKARSELLHGSSSPRGIKTKEQAKIAEGLARLCILCAAQIYPMMLKVYGDCGPDKLEEDMDKICKDGIDWLVQLASTVSSRRVQ